MIIGGHKVESGVVVTLEPVEPVSNLNQEVPLDMEQAVRAEEPEDAHAGWGTQLDPRGGAEHGDRLIVSEHGERLGLRVVHGGKALLYRRGSTQCLTLEFVNGTESLRSDCSDVLSPGRLDVATLKSADSALSIGLPTPLR